MRLKTKKILAILLPVQIIVIKLLGNFPEFIERYYSNGLYPFLSKMSRFLLGWIPFSVGDVLYGALIIYSARWIFKNRNNFRLIPLQLGVSVLAFLSLLSFAFHLFWGMNYYRVPLHKTLNINTEYNTEQLIIVTQQLIENANSIHSQITKNDSLKVSVPNTQTEVFKKISNGYQHVSKTHPQLTYQNRSIKKSLLSLPLTYMGFSGYLNPFTNEAQVNNMISSYHFPFVSCHEIGHQIGYAAENETNFIGYLAAKYNDDIYFKYAAATFAVRNCLNELYRRDAKNCKQLSNTLHLGIHKNFKESRTFWNSYQNPIEPIFKFGFDLFLKSKNQDKGIKSYSYVVALIVNEEMQFIQKLKD